MMMKIISLFLMTFLMIGTLSFVVAEEASDVVPEAKRIGFFENQMDRIRLAFTFNEEKKIERTLNMAEKRLAEAELLAEENPEAYELAQARYDEFVAKAEKILADIESGTEDVNSSVDYIEKIARIQNQFERHRNHAEEVYVRALERFEVNGASAEKIERFENFYGKALDRSNQMEERIMEKRETAVKKHKALSEMSDEEIEELLTKVESSEGLTQNREARMEQAEKRVEKLVEKGAQNIERIQNHFENAEGLTEEQKARIQKRINNAEGRLGQFEERAEERLENQQEVAEQRDEGLKNAIENELENRKGNSEDETA